MKHTLNPFLQSIQPGHITMDLDSQNALVTTTVFTEVVPTQFIGI